MGENKAWRLAANKEGFAGGDREYLSIFIHKKIVTLDFRLQKTLECS